MDIEAERALNNGFGDALQRPSSSSSPRRSSASSATPRPPPRHHAGADDRRCRCSRSSACSLKLWLGYEAEMEAEEADRAWARPSRRPDGRSPDATSLDGAAGPDRRSWRVEREIAVDMVRRGLPVVPVLLALCRPPGVARGAFRRLRHRARAGQLRARRRPARLGRPHLARRADGCRPWRLPRAPRPRHRGRRSRERSAWVAMLPRSGSPSSSPTSVSCSGRPATCRFARLPGAQATRAPADARAASRRVLNSLILALEFPPSAISSSGRLPVQGAARSP